MYAKIINEKIVFPPKHLKEKGRFIANYMNHEEALKADGWLEIIFEKQPEQREGFKTIMKYTERDGKIYQTWEYTEKTEDDLINI